MARMEDCLRDPLIQKDTFEDSLTQKCGCGGTWNFWYLGQSSQDEDCSISLSICVSWEWIWEELKKQFWIAVPMAIVSLLQSAINVISISFVGHLGELELASSSVATSFASVTGFNLLIGMGTTLETLCGQAFGAKQHHEVGVYLQRAIVALNVTAIPVACMWMNMGPLLRALHQDPEISDYAGQYARWMLPTLFAYATLQPFVRFIQIQSAVFPVACCSAVALCLHVPLCGFLTSTMGYHGAAIANGITTWLNVIFLALYIKFSPKFERTWTGLSTEAFQHMRQFIWLAVPSALMICLEYWAFEVILFLSGLLPNPQLEMSTLSISMVILTLLYMIPFGTSAAASTRVSNELGAGRHTAAKQAVGVSIFIAVCEGLIICASFWTLRHTWPYVFTGELEVVEYISSWMPVLAIVPIFDAMSAVLSGVIRGCGRQHLGAYINLGAFYALGFPFAITCAFYLNMRGVGLWIGMVTALFVQCIFLGWITYFADWEELAREAKTRNVLAGDRLPTENIIL